MEDISSLLRVSLISLNLIPLQLHLRKKRKSYCNWLSAKKILYQIFNIQNRAVRTIHCNRMLESRVGVQHPFMLICILYDNIQTTSALLTCNIYMMCIHDMSFI